MDGWWREPRAARGALRGQLAEEGGKSWGSLGKVRGIHVVLLTPGIGLGLTGDSVAMDLALLVENGEEEGDG